MTKNEPNGREAPDVERPTEETEPLAPIPGEPWWDPTVPTQRGGEPALGSYMMGDPPVTIESRARAARFARVRRRGGR